MTWSEIFRNLTEEEIDDAEQDMDWILTALRDPTYLMVKQDNSNQFLLKHSNMYYVEYIRMVLAERGYVLKQAGRFSNAVSIISERDAKTKAVQQDAKSRVSEPKPEPEGFEPGD